MTNYRRLISYIYAYEGDTKGKNIGFAKLESRNGQCKLSVNVKKVYVGSSDLGVYLLSPGKEIYLGNIFIRGGAGEFRTTVSVENAADSGSNLDSCYGLTIHEKEDGWRAYTTIWEDAVAQAAELELADITSEKRGDDQLQIHKKVEELNREIGMEKKEEIVTEEEPQLRNLETETEGSGETDILEADASSRESEHRQDFLDEVLPEQEEQTEAKEAEEIVPYLQELVQPQPVQPQPIQLNPVNPAPVESDVTDLEIIQIDQPEETAQEKSGMSGSEEEDERKNNRQQTFFMNQLPAGAPMHPLNRGPFRREKTEVNPFIVPEALINSPLKAQEREAEASQSPVQQQGRVFRQPQNGIFRQRPVSRQMSPMQQMPMAQQAAATRQTPMVQQATAARQTPMVQQTAATQQMPAVKQTSDVSQTPADQREETNQRPVITAEKDEFVLGDPEELLRLEREERQTIKPKELWEDFRKKYPKIQAFDSAGGCEILTIKPQDIGLLPRETWNYGNNSFLLHGYYNYRYIILARIGDETQGRIRYILGVPGHYYSNEKYMASMFGFPHFVLSKRQPSQDGRFGYWYTDIRMDNQD